MGLENLESNNLKQMAKVITFSTTFPSYHYRKGEPTNFVEKLYNSIDFEQKMNVWNRNDLSYVDEQAMSDCLPKHHTIRKGRRWKKGDMFSPRIWSGRPYFSPQITLSEDVEIKNVWDVEIWISLGCIYIGIPIDEKTYTMLSFGEVAQNDGLTFQEMQHWFDVKVDEPFVGQIICWNDYVNY